MTERGSEQGIQAERPAQRDTRIGAEGPPKQFPPLQWKRKWSDGATLLLLFCAFVGALVGLVGTQFEVVETPWSVPGRTGLSFQWPQSGIDMRMEVRHWGMLMAAHTAHITQSAHVECVLDESGKPGPVPPDLWSKHREREETALVYTAWAYRLGFTVLWAGAGAFFGWWLGRKW